MNEIYMNATKVVRSFTLAAIIFGSTLTAQVTIGSDVDPAPFKHHQPKTD